MIFLESSDAFKRAEKARPHYPNLDMRRLSVGVSLEEDDQNPAFLNQSIIRKINIRKPSHFTNII